MVTLTDLPEYLMQAVPETSTGSVICAIPKNCIFKAHTFETPKQLETSASSLIAKLYYMHE